MSKVWLITGASRGLGRALTEAVFVTVEFDFLDHHRHSSARGGRAERSLIVRAATEHGRFVLQRTRVRVVKQRKVLAQLTVSEVLTKESIFGGVTEFLTPICTRSIVYGVVG
jgi:NAD(P)-dependent dehydrogenase (short-subunit alcohol dehydrogenase family)